MNKKRCGWAQNEPNKSYHDNVWSKVQKDDTKLFEYLILEGAQAGLSWEIILKKQEAYKEAFLNYDLDKLEKLTDKELDKICQNPNIVRNKRKIYSVRQNAIAFKKVQLEFSSFYNYIWSFTNYKQIINKPKSDKEVESKSELSKLIAKDLKKRGFNFVGETIVYSYLQAIGIINDHIETCDFK